MSSPAPRPEATAGLASGDPVGSGAAALQRVRVQLAALQAELDAERGLRREVERSLEANESVNARQFRELALLCRVAVAANEGMTLVSATEEIVTMLARHVGCGAATAWVRDRPEAVLRPSGIWYTANDERIVGLRAAVEARLFVAPGSLPGRVGVTGAPVWIEDLDDDTQFSGGWLSGSAEVDRGLGIRSAFAVPVWMGREVVGVVGLFDADPRLRDDAILELVEQVSTQFGCVVDRFSSRRSNNWVPAARIDRQVVDSPVDQMWLALADIAHEVRTPMSGLLGNLQLLLAQSESGPESELAAGAFAAALRLHQLIEERLLVAEASVSVAAPAT